MSFPTTVAYMRELALIPLGCEKGSHRMIRFTSPVARMLAGALHWVTGRLAATHLGVSPHAKGDGSENPASRRAGFHLSWSRFIYHLRRRRLCRRGVS